MARATEITRTGQSSESPAPPMICPKYTSLSRWVATWHAALVATTARRSSGQRTKKTSSSGPETPDRSWNAVPMKPHSSAPPVRSARGASRSGTVRARNGVNPSVTSTSAGSGTKRTSEKAAKASREPIR